MSPLCRARPPVSLDSIQYPMTSLNSERSISRSKELYHRSTSPPTIISHPQILPHAIPTPALVESVAGAAHYSGVKVDSGAMHHRRRSSAADEHYNILKEEHVLIMKDLLELYCCRPTLEIFERGWRKDAICEDSFSKCKGYDEYAAKWFAMSKLFSHSETKSTRVMSSTLYPNQLIYHQVQEYTLRITGAKRTVASIIVVDMDGDNKIVHLNEQSQGSHNWFGANMLRTLSGKVTPWLVHVPKYSP